MKKIISLCVFVLAAVLSVANAGSVNLTQADGGPAFSVSFESGSHTVVLQSAKTYSSNWVVTVDGANTTLNTDTASYNTLGELMDGVAAATNKSGAAPLTVVQKACTRDDNANGSLLGIGYTAVVAGVDLNVTWDTDRCSNYVAYGKADNQPVVVKKIIGNPSGAGDVTFSVYVDTNLMWQSVGSQPATVFFDSWTNQVLTNVISSVVNAPSEDILVPVNKGEKFWVRAARTTADAGNIGYVVEPQ